MKDVYNSLDLDILKEIGNIGAGNATTSLSQMLNKTIQMGIPEVKIADIGNVAGILGGEENLVAGILIRVTGEIEGLMMYILEYSSVCNLLNMLLGKQLKDTTELNEMDMSALHEIGNILIGSYLTALSKLTGLTMMQSIPRLAIDMAGAILSVPAIQFGKTGDNVLFIKTGFNEGENNVTGYYILIPEVQSFEKIMKSLGVV